MCSRKPTARRDGPAPTTLSGAVAGDAATRAEEIAQQIADILGDKQLSLQEICTTLITAANAGGGPDNITALVVEVNGRADGGPGVNARADAGPEVDAP